MKFYVDIRLKPDAGMPLNRLLNSIYTKLHKALWDVSSSDIGVSFPNYKLMLGNVLRLYGSQAALASLAGGDWMGEMKDCCVISDVLAVPSDVKYRVISRKQSTMSQSKLNRLLRRGSISEADAKAYRAKMFTKGLDNAYVELVSASNGQKHRRYIEFGPLLAESIEGKFDTFGLSKTATVPWF